MSNRTSKQISSDKLLDKIVKDSVTKHRRRILFFSLRGTEVNINGEKDCVDILEKGTSGKVCQDVLVSCQDLFLVKFLR